jgi:O-antigen/teichoic acid export membrane protein
MAHLFGVNLIFFVRILVLARILAPDAFGLLAIAMVPIGLLLQATEFGMVPALVHVESPRRRHYDVAWTVGLLRGLATSGLVFLAAPWIARLAGEPRAAEITRVLALYPLLIAASSMRLADLQRRLDFRPLAILHLGEAVSNAIVSIALAPRLGVWALVAGTLAGSVGRLVISYLVAPYRPRLFFQRSAALSLIRFGRWVFVAALLTTTGGALLRLIVSRQLGAAELGVYYLATRLTFLLVGTVIDVGTSVSFPIYARLKEDRDEAVRVFQAVLSATAALVVPAFALLAALAPSLVAHVLGAQWEGSAPVLGVLALVCILSILGDVAAPIWQGMGQPWRNALLEGIQVAVLLPGVLWLTGEVGVVGAGLAWIPAVVVTQVISAAFLPRVLPGPFTGLAGVLLAIGTASVSGAALAIGIDTALEGLGGLLAGALGGGGLCLVLLWLADRYLSLGLARSLVRVFPRLERRR